MSDTARPATLTLGAAVKAVEVSRSTLQRRLRDGKVPGAVRGDDGEWAIPFAGLIAAGLTARRTAADPEPDPAGELERVRMENAHLRQQLELVETLSRERAEALGDARASLEVERERVRELLEHNPAPVIYVEDKQPSEFGPEEVEGYRERPRRAGRLGRFLGFD